MTRRIVLVPNTELNSSYLKCSFLTTGMFWAFWLSWHIFSLFISSLAIFKMKTYISIVVVWIPITIGEFFTLFLTTVQIRDGISVYKISLENKQKKYGIWKHFWSKVSVNECIERRHSDPFKFLFLPKMGILGSQASTWKNKPKRGFGPKPEIGIL